MDRLHETLGSLTSLHSILHDLDNASSPTQFEQARLGAELLGVPRRVTEQATIFADLYRGLNDHAKLALRGNGLVLLYGVLEVIGVSVAELKALEVFVNFEKLKEVEQIIEFGFAKMVLLVCNCVGQNDFRSFADISLAYLGNRYSLDHFPTMESLLRKLIDKTVFSPQNVTNLTKILTDSEKEASLVYVQEYRRLAGLLGEDTEAGTKEANEGPGRFTSCVQEQESQQGEQSPTEGGQGVQETQENEIAKNKQPTTATPAPEGGLVQQNQEGGVGRQPTAATDNSNAEQAYVANPVARPPLDSKLVLQPKSPPVERPAPTHQAVTRQAVNGPEADRHEAITEDIRPLIARNGSPDREDTIDRDYPPQDTINKDYPPQHTSPPRSPTATERTKLLHKEENHVQNPPVHQVKITPSPLERYMKRIAYAVGSILALALLAFIALIATGRILTNGLNGKIDQNIYNRTEFLYEDQPIFLGTINSRFVTGAIVMEKTENGDRTHQNYVYLIPQHDLKEHHRHLQYAQITKYQDAPTLAGGLIRAVYLYRGYINYTIYTTFESADTGEAWLYIFSSRSAFEKYRDGSPPNAAYKQRLNIGKHPMFEPTHIQFNATKAGYYYIAVALPANVYYNYVATIDQVYFDRLDYSPLCTEVYGNDHTCKIDLTTREPGVYYVLGWAKPNSDLGSTTTHLQLSTSGVAESVQMEQVRNNVIWVVGVALMGFLMLIMLVVVWLLWRCRPSLQKGQKQYERLV